MKKRYILPGLILILAGIYFLIGALPGVEMPFGAFVALIGAAMLITRLFLRGRYGLTIAGFVVFWLGASWTFLSVLDIRSPYILVATPLALSLAFFFTHICEYRRIGNWPMVPALILLFFSILFFLMLTPEVNAILAPYYGTILPLILILIGVCVLVRGVRKSRREKAAWNASRNSSYAQQSQQNASAYAQQPQPEPAQQEPAQQEPVTAAADPIVVDSVPESAEAAKDGDPTPDA